METTRLEKPLETKRYILKLYQVSPKIVEERDKISSFFITVGAQGANSRGAMSEFIGHFFLVCLSKSLVS